ncbi:DUF3775 domain-containing protein [Caenispirillum salinarum]|uniref:DUF3775 domain-containing protein n=1 Tax=Caenispirillum salinarum TaxID=859058 RepID=UPI00384C7577
MQNILDDTDGSESPELVTPLATYAFLIARARHLDAAEQSIEADMELGPLETPREAVVERDATRDELREALDDLTDDQKAEVLAVVWLGRGDYDPSTWDDALADAASGRTRRAAAYLMETPGLGDLMAEGLASLGVPEDDLEDVE